VKDTTAQVVTYTATDTTDSNLVITQTAAVTFTTPPSVTVTQVARSGNSPNYSLSGSVFGGGSVSVTIYSSYTVGTCTAGTVKATVPGPITGTTYTTGTTALTAGTTYYVKADESGPSATSGVYSFVAPTAQSGTVTPTATGC
jgi:hypothetical protein